jgi:hypothetical protein
VTNNVKSGGMHARPVIGGVFIKMLADEQVWKKWASRDKAKVGNWAPMPKPPQVTTLIPDARTEAATWKYTTDKPADGWTQATFDDSAWKSGKAGFGSKGTPGAVVNTPWKSADIWLRREVTVPQGPSDSLHLMVYHDEDVQVYVNGVLATDQAGYVNNYEPVEISANARQLLKPGAKVVIAVHCHQTKGGQGVDVGLANVVEAK